MRFMKMRPALALKLLIVTEVLLLVAIIAMLLPVRQEMARQAEADLQQKLLSIAGTASLLLSPEDLKQVRTTQDATSPAFARIKAALLSVRAVNQDLTQENIYTLFQDKTATEGREERPVVKFGVMTHDKPFTGETLEWHSYMAPAFEQNMLSASPLYTDKYGEWISAFAPITDSEGKLVAVLEVDQPAEKYFAAYERVKLITMSIAAAALAIGSMLGWIVINRVVLQPMRAVRGGMLALSRQDFTHQVKLRTMDEFQDLATLLNDLSRQLNAARQVAQGFTPKELPSAPGWELAAMTEPCEATAGDYYDAFPLPAREDRPAETAVLVADVTGHGLGPSLHMSACRSALRALAGTGLPPGELLSKVDALLQNDLENGRFITMLYGVLSADGTFTFCNAGHGPALILRKGQVLTLDAHRPPLGIPWDPIEGEEDQTTLVLEAGDRLLLCSDGVSEAMDAKGAQLGTEPLITMLSTTPGLSPNTLLMQIKKLILTHAKGHPAGDDITMLCVERKGDTVDAPIKPEAISETPIPPLT